MRLKLEDETQDMVPSTPLSHTQHPRVLPRDTGKS